MRRMRDGAEPWVRFLRRAAIAIEIISFCAVFCAGLTDAPTWDRLALAALFALTFWSWNQIHEATNELLGIH